MKRAVLQDGRFGAAAHDASVGTTASALPDPESQIQSPRPRVPDPKSAARMFPAAHTPSPTTASPAAGLSQRVPPAVALSATPDALRFSAERRLRSPAVIEATAAAQPVAVDDQSRGSHSIPHVTPRKSPAGDGQKMTTSTDGGVLGTEPSAEASASASFSFPLPQRDGNEVSSGTEVDVDVCAVHLPSPTSNNHRTPPKTPPSEQSSHATADRQVVPGIEVPPLLSDTSQAAAAGTVVPDPVGAPSKSADHKKQREHHIFDNIAEKLGMAAPPAAGERLPCSVHLPDDVIDGALIVSSTGGDTTRTILHKKSYYVL